MRVLPGTRCRFVLEQFGRPLLSTSSLSNTRTGGHSHSRGRLRSSAYGPPDWKSPLRELSDRLGREYGEHVTRFARGFGLWGSRTFTSAGRGVCREPPRRP